MAVALVKPQASTTPSSVMETQRASVVEHQAEAAVPALPHWEKREKPQLTGCMVPKLWAGQRGMASSKKRRAVEISSKGSSWGVEKRHSPSGSPPAQALPPDAKLCTKGYAQVRQRDCGALSSGTSEDGNEEVPGSSSGSFSLPRGARKPPAHTLPLLTKEGGNEGQGKG